MEKTIQLELIIREIFNVIEEEEMSKKATERLDGILTEFYAESQKVKDKAEENYNRLQKAMEFLG